LESDIKEAIRLQQFYLVLQPQIELATGRLVGFEALLRWLHPQRGIVTPDEFITVLENSPQMVELGYWVFRRSFEIVQSLIARGYPNIRLAINLSAGQAYRTDFSKNIDATLTAMRQLKAMGFCFSIDDFGTGYSSLSYLKQMPVDVIKIDKSFVFGMLENDADYQIIASTIAMVSKVGVEGGRRRCGEPCSITIAEKTQMQYWAGLLFCQAAE
ncbi:GGDEF/EAL domain protein, partial [Reticulomyxa filosa]